MLRVPSRSAVAAPESGVPPAATTPTRANWLAPVNISRDRTHVWATLRPEATDTAPNPRPYAPVATPDGEAVADDPRPLGGIQHGVTHARKARTCPVDASDAGGALG